jgi:hypothetical protein
LIEHTIRYGIDSQSIAAVANQLGLFLYQRAAYAQAEPLMRRALEIDKKSYGLEHPRVARDLFAQRSSVCDFGNYFCAFSCPVNCVVGGFEEVRIQMLKLGHSHSSGGKAWPESAKYRPTNQAK